MRLPLRLWCTALVVALSIPLPAQSDLSVFFGNLHSHTGLGDGRGTPFAAYEHARDVAGLDYLAITEHNHAHEREVES